MVKQLGLSRLKAARPNLRQTMQERVREHLRGRIVSGEFKCGEQLGETRLTAELDVGPIPLREALGRLEADGLVEYRSYCGFRVREITAQDIKEIYELRLGLECLAIDLLAGREMEPLLGELRDCLAVIDASPIEMSDTARNEQEHHFHGAIVSTTGNRLLLKIFELNGLHCMFTRNVAPNPPMPPMVTETEATAVYPAHREIYEALAAKDFIRARALDAEHIRTGMLRVLARWTAAGVTTPGDTARTGE